jgi:cell division protein FtsL
MSMYLRELVRTILSDAYRVGRVLVVIAVPVALLLTHVWYQVRITQLGYQISEETDRHEKLADEHRKLQIETAVEGRNERLADRAKRRFGLEQIDPDQVITVEPQNGAPPESFDQTEHAALDNSGGD